MHQDLLLHINHPEEFLHKKQTSFELLEEANVKVVVATAFPFPNDGNYTSRACLELIESDLRKYNEIVETKDNWRIILTKADLEEVMANDSFHGIILHVEGLYEFRDVSDDWDMKRMGDRQQRFALQCFLVVLRPAGWINS